jgi:hypothetical protein
VVRESTPVEVVRESTPVEVVRESTPVEVVRESTPATAARGNAQCKQAQRMHPFGGPQNLQKSVEAGHICFASKISTLRRTKKWANPKVGTDLRKTSEILTMFG